VARGARRHRPARPAKHRALRSARGARERHRGFGLRLATFASYLTIDPEITWAKLAAMAEGARLASAELW
jgi:hypothetical protein